MGAGVSVEGCSALPLQEREAKEKFVNLFGELEASLNQKTYWTPDERLSLRQALEAGRGYYEGLIERAPAQRSNLEEMRAKRMTPFLNVYRETFKNFVDNDPALKEFVATANDFADSVNEIAPRQSAEDVVTLYEDGAARMRTEFESLITKSPAGKTTVAPLKHLGRILEKMMLKPNEKERFKADKVLDVVRGMIECENMTDMLRALRYVCQDSSHGWRVVRIKNRFDSGLATSGGWVDCLLNVVSDLDKSRHVCEIQLVHAKMMVLRAQLGGHDEYFKFRTADEFLQVIDGDCEDGEVTKSPALLELEEAYDEAKSRPKKDFSQLKTLKKKIQEQKRLDMQVARLRARKVSLLLKLSEATEEERWETAESLQAEISDVETALAEAETASSSKHRQEDHVIATQTVSEDRPRPLEYDDCDHRDDREADEDWENAIVIDNGTWKIKAGHAGEDTPAVVLSPMVGRSKTSFGVTVGGTGAKESFVGDDAEARRGILDITCPIERGIIKNWDDMEKIWHHLFYSKLRCAPEERPIVLTEVPLNPKANRERMISLLFDVFSSPAVYIAVSAVLSLYSAGRTTGCVVSSGAQVTHVTPVYEGNTIPFAVKILEIAGNHVTDSLQRMLRERGYSFETPLELEIVRDMKEKLGFVAQDYECAMAGSDDVLYEMPDGQVLTLCDERFRCAEGIFNPAVIGSEGKGLSETVVNSVSACDVDIQQDLYKSVLLDGGGTMLNGFDARLQYELDAKTPRSTNIKIVSGPERQYATWVGGSILASLSTFQQMWITRDEYKEAGPSIVHRKCMM